jgi:hypothetical protein
MFIFISCDGSDDIQGKWKAMDPKGNKFEIAFSPRKFSIKDSKGILKEYTYTQTSFKHENATDTYGIRLNDGRGYEIFFPTNYVSRLHDVANFVTGIFPLR